jgi:hypothetical protein
VPHLYNESQRAILEEAAVGHFGLRIEWTQRRRPF